MPKAEAGSAKWLSNKMKSKGLQKLRWYCQMCQKQCRDENGFKCHISSESHQRQLLVVAENPHSFIGDFSKEFEKGYVDLLRRQFGTKRVNANVVYQAYIADKEHIHMNATHWTSLSGFVQTLGRKGTCVIDQTEKGWYITYIDRDPENARRLEALSKRKKVEKDDAEKALQNALEMAERGKAQSGGADSEAQFTELMRENEDEKVAFGLGSSKSGTTSNLQPSSALEDEASSSSKSAKPKEKVEKSRKSTLGEILKEEERRKERQNRKENWICENIIVKVVTKDLGDAFYKAKGRIVSVENDFGAVVKMVNSGKKIKVDQACLETVIPNVGRLARVVNGAYRGCTVTVDGVNVDKFCVTAIVSSGPLKDRKISVPYEDICKLHVEPQPVVET